jgi:surfeit locus 1 family protein
VSGVLGTLALFAVAALCVRLGFWQLDRLAERRARNLDVASRLEEPPVELDEVPHDSAGWTYRRVVLEGSYDPDGLIVYPGRSLGGVPGAHVVTPLVLKETGTRVLVNRGWLPAADGAHPDLAQVSEAGQVRVTGVVVPFPGGRTPPAPGVVSPSDTFRRIWFSIDPAEIRAQYPHALGAIAVQLVPEEGAPRLPARLQPPALDEGPHRGYAIQWFSFAIIALVGWAALVMKGTTRARIIARSPPAPH